MRTRVFSMVLNVVHTVFEGFDIYSVEIQHEKGIEKLLFHKQKEKEQLLGDVFQYLGTNENLWLCKNIFDGKYHVSPFCRFLEAISV